MPRFLRWLEVNLPFDFFYNVLKLSLHLHMKFDVYLQRGPPTMDLPGAVTGHRTSRQSLCTVSRAFQHVLQHQHISPTRQHSSPTHLDVSQGRSKKFEAASPASHFGTPFQLPTFLERKRRQGNKIHQLYFVSFSPAETGKVLNTGQVDKKKAGTLLLVKEPTCMSTYGVLFCTLILGRVLTHTLLYVM